jgi:hypothetical protein
MSIRPSVIDRTGQQPCLPANALLAVCERLGRGRHRHLAAAHCGCLGSTSRPPLPMTPHTSRQRVFAAMLSANRLGHRAWSLNR